MPIPRWLAGRPRVALAPSRVVPVTCTTRYGEAPIDTDIAELLARLEVGPAEFVPWMAVSQKDEPSGTVWRILLCPPLDPASGLNLREGREPGGPSGESVEIVLPEALWILTLLAEGRGHARGVVAPSGTWVSRWEDGQVALLEGPRAAPPEEGCEVVAWRNPTQAELLRLFDEHPDSQMLSGATARLRREGLDNMVALGRSLVVLLTVVLLGASTRIPVAWARHLHDATTERLAAQRPAIERLERLHERALRESRALDASRRAFLPNGSPLDLLVDLSRRLPQAVRLRNLQLDSPPTDSVWTLRAEATLQDWRSVSSLVDSLRTSPGTRDVRVLSQQREKQSVHLVLALTGAWK